MYINSQITTFLWIQTNQSYWINLEFFFVFWDSYQFLLDEVRARFFRNQFREGLYRGAEVEVEVFFNAPKFAGFKERSNNWNVWFHRIKHSAKIVFQNLPGILSDRWKYAINLRCAQALRKIKFFNKLSYFLLLKLFQLLVFK